MRSLTAIAVWAVLAVAGGALTAVPAAAQERTTDLIVALERPAVVALDGDVAILDSEQVAEDLVTVTVPAADAADAIAALADDPAVAYVERDVQARIVGTPTDPRFGQQWGSVVTGLPAVWDTTTGAADVVVAVIDTGVNRSHEDLSGARFVPGYDFVNNDANPDDDHGHGTAAAGVIAAQHNSTGTAGACPRCAIMPLKAMAADGTGSHVAIRNAVDFAVANGADIINLSLGSEASTWTLEQSIARAASAGVLVVAAAGNAGVATPFYPAAYDGAVGVAASEPGDGRYSWSNYGSWVSVAAPGCNVAPAYDGRTNALGYDHFCGTSSAAPLVAGLAGLLASARPDASAATLRTALQTTAAPVSYVSTGRVAGAAALASLQTAPPPGGGGGGGGGGGVTPPDDSAGAGEPAVDTAISVSPSATSITYGAQVEIAGRVLSSASLQGASVELLTRVGGGGWTRAGQRSTDAAGNVTFSHQPGVTTDYRLRFAGLSGQSASESEVVTVSVQPVIDAAATRGNVVAGTRTVVKGAVGPARGGLPLVLERKTAKGWARVVNGQTGKSGGYRLTTSSPVGATTYRVRFPGADGLEAQTSATFAVVGERVRVAAVTADAPGDDRRNLNGEFIVLRNTGTTPVQLRGWSVRSASTGKTFALPGYRLPAGARVAVHSGAGRNRKGHVHLDAGREVWRNGRDTAVLRHPSGAVAARRSWR